MQVKIEEFQKNIEKFKLINFIPEIHTYEIGGKVAKSVTSIIKEYLKPFERDYWANIKAKQLGVDVNEILEKWQFNAKFSQIKGTLVHEFIEYKLTNREFIYPQELIECEFGFDPIQEPFHQIINVVNKYLSDIQDKLVPVASELIIGDIDYLVCGTVDQVFYNKKSNNLEIWDWKTNKEIKLESRYFHLQPLSHIPDTELDHYSLQLSLYKLILEKNTGITLGNSYITWFNENLPKYQIFTAKDYYKEAQILLNNIVKGN